MKWSLTFTLIFASSALVAEGETPTSNPTQENTAMAAAPYPTSICKISSLYTPAFTYSLPESILKDYFSGNAFDHKENYTPEEKVRLERDIDSLYRHIMREGPDRKRSCLITAGAPGAGKTTLLEATLTERSTDKQTFAYTDPDAVCLKGQTETYRADLAAGMSDKDAYTKWRPASNAANHLLLANLIREGFNFAFGTTSTAPQTKFFFEFLKKQGYTIEILHVSAPDRVRFESTERHPFLHTTEEDIREKGLLLPQRLNDTFFKYADTINFYVRSEVDKDAELAASWNRGHKLVVISPSAYEKVKEIHNAATEVLLTQGKTVARWDEALAAAHVTELFP